MFGGKNIPGEQAFVHTPTTTSPGSSSAVSGWDWACWRQAKEPAGPQHGTAWDLSHLTEDNLNHMPIVGEEPAFRDFDCRVQLQQKKNWPQKESQPCSCTWEEFKTGRMQGAASHSEMKQMKNLDLKASRLWGSSGPNLCFPTSHISLVVVSCFTWLSSRVFQEAAVETYWFQFCLIFWETVQKAGIWPRLMSKLHWTLQAPLLAF